MPVMTCATLAKRARAYLADPIFGARLKTIIEALQDLKEPSGVEVFSLVDASKLRSCLTVFSEAGGGALFEAVCSVGLRAMQTRPRSS